MPRLKRSVTVDKVMGFSPCLSREEVEALFAGRKRLTLASLEKIPVEQLPYEDRLWLLLREDFLPVKTLYSLACKFAERPLRRERKAGREPDERSWDALRVQRRWLCGKATDADMRSAAYAAWSAAENNACDFRVRSAAYAAWSAANAVRSAARSAADAGWTAAGRAADAAYAAEKWGTTAADAAWRAERLWQYRAVLKAVRAQHSARPPQ